mgnify:CR=1 FL=1
MLTKLLGAPWLLLFLTLAVGAVGLFGVSKLKSEEDLLVFLPEGDADVTVFRDVASRFGALRVALIGVEPKPGQKLFSPDMLSRIDRLSTQLKNTTGVDRVVSPTTINDLVPIEGGVDLTLLVPQPIPTDQVTLDKVKARALSQPTIRGNVVSADGEAGLIMVFVGDGVPTRQLAEKAQALARKQDGRARFDCTSSGTGLGAVTRNIFSFTGPLPVACNRIIADDCADPDRRNYWVTVIANANDYAATSYQIVWGSSAAQYSRLGVCGPQGTDGDESSVPKLLMPTRDVDQSGQVEACYEHTTGSLSFYLDSPDVRIPIRDIAAIRDLRVRNKDILHADAPTRAKHRFRVDRLIVDVQRPDDSWQTVQLATNLDNDKEPFLQWTQELTCP